VELDGSGARLDANGLVIDADGSTIKGLVINRFGGDGIYISPLATGSRIEGNFIGTAADGTTDRGNEHYGVLVGGDSNTIGGTAAGARNVISGNEIYGVYILNFVSDNRVEGNFIGTTADGTGDLGNGSYGVLILNSENNTVGGQPAERATASPTTETPG
jgi:hypothetical protein